MKRAVLVLLLLSGCAAKRKPALFVPVQRPGYNYMQIDKNHWIVVADPSIKIDDAARDAGCSPCAVQPRTWKYYELEGPKK